MANIMSIFYKIRESNPEGKDIEDLNQTTYVHDSGASSRDIAGFEVLGERQQMISGGIESVIRDLGGFANIVEELIALKADISRTFESHRHLAMENSNLLTDNERLTQGLREKSALYDAQASDLRITKASLEEVNRNLKKALADLEGLEGRYQLLSVAKKDASEQLQRVQSQLATSQEEATSLLNDITSLREHSETQAARITDLSEKYKEANSSSLFLANRCELLETNVQEKTVEAIGLRELVDLLAEEKEAALLYARQKEQDAAQARADASRLFQQAQQEKKARDSEIGKMRVELDVARSNLKTHEEISAEVRVQSEQLAGEVSRLDERNRTLEAINSRIEAHLARITAKLEATTSAKEQIEQSRAVIITRLDALTQNFAEREANIRRLEVEVDSLMVKNEKQAAMSSDAIEVLQNRIFELEKELAARQNETAFYASQVEAINRQGIKFSKAS